MDNFANALKRLCDTRGGHVHVAQQIDANPQTIHQIISGVKLPSGNPRGVGPNLRKRLDAAYPGWADASEQGSVFSEITADERAFLEAFRCLTDQDRAKYMSEISARAAELRQYIDKYLGPIKNGHTVKKP